VWRPRKAAKMVQVLLFYSPLKLDSGKTVWIVTPCYNATEDIRTFSRELPAVWGLEMIKYNGSTSVTKGLIYRRLFNSASVPRLASGDVIRSLPNRGDIPAFVRRLRKTTQ
jgi:hypothetical protein